MTDTAPRDMKGNFQVQLFSLDVYFVVCNCVLWNQYDSDATPYSVWRSDRAEHYIQYSVRGRTND